MSVNFLHVFRSVAVIVLIGLLVAACGDEATTSRGVADHLKKPAPALDARATVAALREESDRGVAGAWSFVRNLGIGVYTVDGTQILAGSEQSEDDFWLYDFQLPLIAKLAQADDRPSAQLIADARGSQSPAALKKTLVEAYGMRGSAGFVGQMLEALDADFTEGVPTQLNPLASWLVLLDSSVPPNRGKSPVADVIEGGAVAGATDEPDPDGSSTDDEDDGANPFAAPGECSGTFTGIVLDGWGWAWDMRPEDVPHAEAVFRELNAQLLAEGFSVEIDVVPAHVHEAHSGEKPDRAAVIVQVRLDYAQEFVKIGCGLLSGMTSHRGPLTTVPVRLSVSDDLEPHGGLLKGGPRVTDSLGVVDTEYVVDGEVADGEGDLESTTGQIIALVEPKRILVNLGIEPTIAAAVRPRAWTAPLTAEWHQSNAWKFSTEVPGTAMGIGITAHLEASTCDGADWTGTIGFEGSGSQGSFDATGGVLGFRLEPGGEATLETNVSGTWTPPEFNASITEVLRLDLSWERQHWIDITLGSTGKGKATVPEVGTLPFAVMAGRNRGSADLVPNTSCAAE